MIEACPDQIKALVLEYLWERFGITADPFANFRFYASAAGRVILGPVEIDERLVPDTAGLSIARIGRTVKPTTNLLQLYGHLATKNFVVLRKENASRFIQGLDIKIDDEEKLGAEDGYVLVKYESYSLGCGLLRTDQIKNMIPKAKRQSVKYL